MFFRNLSLFRIPADIDFGALDEGLEACRLKPVGPQEMSAHGFVAPLGGEQAPLSHALGDGLWLTLGGQDRLLPPAVLNDAVGKRAAEIEQREGRQLGGRARRRLREELLLELIPRAFVRPSRLGIHIDRGLGVVAVDTASRRAAELAVGELRRALGRFPALPLNAEVAPRAVLTGWLAGETLPEGLVLGDACELRDPADRGAVIKAQRQELGGEEIGKHLEAGKQCARLALTLDGHLGFELGEDLVVRKLKFLDGAVQALEGDLHETPQAELDARYALLCGEFKRLFTLLEATFRLSRAQG